MIEDYEATIHQIALNQDALNVLNQEWDFIPSWAFLRHRKNLRARLTLLEANEVLFQKLDEGWRDE